MNQIPASLLSSWPYIILPLEPKYHCTLGSTLEQIDRNQPPSCRVHGANRFIVPLKQGSVRGKRCNPPPRQFGCYYLDSHNLGQLPVQREPFLPHLIEWSTLVTIPPAWLMLVFVSSSSRNGSSRVYTPVPQRALRLYGYPLVSGNASAAISLTDQQQLRVVLRQSALRFIWSGTWLLLKWGWPTESRLYESGFRFQGKWHDALAWHVALVCPSLRNGSILAAVTQRQDFENDPDFCRSLWVKMCQQFLSCYPTLVFRSSAERHWQEVMRVAWDAEIAQIRSRNSTGQRSISIRHEGQPMLHQDDAKGNATSKLKRGLGKTLSEIVEYKRRLRKEAVCKAYRATEVECRRTRDGGTRIAWLHIPKCGTSFFTTLAHYANASLPDAAVMPVCSHDGLLVNDAFGAVAVQKCSNTNCTKRYRERCVHARSESTFLQSFPLQTWFSCTFWHKELSIGDHSGIDEETYAHFKGRFFAMFRQPADRVASSFDWFQSEFHPRIEVTPYAKRVVGTMTKMLSGQSSGADCSAGFHNCSSALVEPNVSLAISRLREGFAFVGLTSRWALSICLFHAQFGGRCLPVEFENSRPTSSLTPLFTKKSESAMTRLELLRNVSEVEDRYDAAIYAVASARFWADVHKHQLSVERCIALCPQSPEQFNVSSFEPM